MERCSDSEEGALAPSVAECLTTSVVSVVAGMVLVVDPADDAGPFAKSDP